MDRDYEKHFIPLESDPTIFTHLIHALGAPQSLCFEEVFSLDEPDFLPHPAHALILVFPTDENYEYRKAEQYAVDQGCTEDDDNVIWYRQTIHNACGLYGVLHALSNGAARALLGPGSLLASFLATPSEERSLALENSQQLEDIYADVAKQGTSHAPSAEEEVDLHYVCFVKSRNGHLYELDGDRKGPIDRGQVLGPEDDVLADGGLNVIREYIRHGQGDIRFELMALVEKGVAAL